MQLTVVEISRLRAETYRDPRTIRKWGSDPATVQPSIREQLDAAAERLKIAKPSGQTAESARLEK